MEKSGRKIYYENLEFLLPFEMLGLEDIRIVRESGRHTVLTINFMIPADKAEEYILKSVENSPVEVKVKSADEKITIFKGITTGVTLTAKNGVNFINLEAKSVSIKLAMKEKSRSFQNIKGSYSDIFNEVLAEYQGSYWLPDDMNKSKQERLIVQYMESDWDFLKRISSHFGKKVLINDCVDRIMVYGGSAESGVRELEEVTRYKVCKDIEKSLSLSNYGVDLPEYEFISYEIETENLMFPGNKYNIFGNEFIVSKVVTTLKRNYLHQRVKLVRENGMIEGLIKNEKIEGVSLRGKILEVNGALVKVHLNIDKEQNKGEAYNFSYTTPHSAGGNTGWYMMPKVEEEVEVHFPLNYEERAYARGTSRTSSKSLPNAGTKELNVHGRNMTMDGSAVTFNAKNDKEGQVHIKTTKGKGVEITSLYDIHLGADGDFALDSKSISMSCGQEFIMMCKGSSLYIDKDTYHFAGTVLKKEGIIKAPIPPFPENKVEEPKKEEPEKDESMGTLDWIQAGLAIGGFIPGVGIACDILNAGISACRGDWVGVGLSLVAAVPLIGDAAAGANLIAKGGKLASAANKLIKAGKLINTCTKLNKISKAIRVVTMTVGTALAGYTIGTCAYKLATGQKLTNKEKVQLILSITAIGTLWKIAKSDPVDAIKGDVYVESEDFALTGNIPLSWTRYYRSSSENIGHCGLGWSTPADARIELSREIGLLIFYDGGDVPKHFIDLPEDGETSYELVSGDKLTRVKNEYRIKLKNGLTYIIPVYNEDDEVMYVGRIEDSFGNYTEYSRVNNILKTIKESSGRVISVESRNGLITGLYLNDNGAKRTLVRYEYSEKHELLKVYDGENLPYEYRYKNGVMISHTNRKGFSFYYKYDQYSHEGKCLHAYGDDGVLDYNFAYDSENRKTEVTDSNGNREIIEYNEYFIPVKVTDNKGGITEYGYDNRCRRNKIVDPEGNITEYKYDDYGNMVEEIYADGKSLKREYDENHKIKSITAPNGAEWKQEWNEKGLLTKSITPLGAEYSYSYDERGNLIEAVNPKGSSTKFEYDRYGNLLKYVDEEGKESKYSYDIYGNLTEKREQGGRVTKYMYDRKSRLKGVILPDKSEIFCSYDPCDNLISYRDEAGNLTKYEYDGNSNLIKKISPDGTTVEYEYDTEEKLTAVINQKGERYELTRDELGRIIEEKDYWGNSRYYEYSPSGNLLKSIDPLGRAVEYITDKLGRITEKRAEDVEEKYSYDDNGNLVKAENRDIKLVWDYDKEGKLIKEEQGDDFVIENFYDELGQRVTRETRYKGVKKTLEYRYSPTGKPLGISINGKETANFEYDSRGRLWKEKLGTLQKRYIYDESDRVKSQSVLGETGELFKTEYNYDRTGNLKSRNDSINGKDEYYYDPVGRIKKNIDPMKRVKEFVHDKAGNYLKTEIKEEENSWKRLGTYDKISYEYDKAGNLIQRADTTFKWDSNNRLVTSQNNNIKTEYKYDPLGRRISKETEGKITNFYWEGNKLISDTERDYHYYPYSFEPLAMETKDKLYYYHNDINGAPLRLTDEKGNIVWNVHYNIFGKIDKLSKNEIDNPIRMQGQYEDEETGLYYNRYRYYDPNISAYVSQDPLGLGAGENVYSYTLNSFGWIDPLGLSCEKVLGGRFADVDAKKGSNEVGHHMAQNAYNKTIGVSRNDGPALLMTKEDHELTRTFRWKGAQTMKTDEGLTARQRMALDVMDIRKNFGTKYNKGMLQAIEYSKKLPQYQK